MRYPRLLPALLMALGFLCAGASRPLAATSALASVEVLEPGITLRLVCTTTDASCNYQDANGIEVSALALGEGGSQHDAAGFQLVQGDEPGGGGPCGPCTSPFAVSHAALARWHPDGTVRPLVRFLGSCNGVISESKFINSIRVDAIRGTALVWVATIEEEYISGGPNTCTNIGGERFEELIEIAGLPSILDILRRLPRGLIRPRGGL